MKVLSENPIKHEGILYQIHYLFVENVKVGQITVQLNPPYHHKAIKIENVIKINGI